MLSFQRCDNIYTIIIRYFNTKFFLHVSTESINSQHSHLQQACLLISPSAQVSQKHKKNKPFKTAKHLSITKEFREVDVEYMSCSLHHDIIIVSVTYTQYVCGYTVSSTW